MPYPASYYSDPIRALEDCRKRERFISQKKERKRRRGIYGCLCCARYNHELNVCGQGQVVTVETASGSKWCSWHWDNLSNAPAPEISR